MSLPESIERLKRQHCIVCFYIMLGARVFNLSPGISAFCRCPCVRNKSTSKTSDGLRQQGKIFRTLLGNRVKGSKKRWYPAQDDKFSRSDSQPTTGVSLSRPHASKSNNRRISVLNKLFMTNITDFLATSEISESIVGRGMQVSYVNITRDFSQVNVYWMGQGDEEANQMLEQELFRCSGQLQHELSQLRLMGEVPRIRFHRDKTGIHLHQVQDLLSKLGRDGKLEAENSEDLKENDSESCSAPTETSIVPKTWPKMRQDVLNLNHHLIMDKIYIKMRKSKEAWDSYTREKSNAPKTEPEQENEKNAKE
ncbi:putative ribosome-binding factor A, mitochondrial [Drosophila bipectinata]|uniref:putative ribosome-binding factor A, mitochondrial n=1 Tax=Drosophila bipectinata TaxID=42026 RepID=UPI001C8AD43E|nr:uncharacterized protein LOC108122341 [Drosophila bipectinata]